MRAYRRDTSTSGASPYVALLQFANSSDAERALRRVRADYADCTSAPHTDTVTGEVLVDKVEQTASSTGCVAYFHDFRRRDGGQGSPANIPSDNHAYFAVQGRTLAFVRVSVGFRIDDSSAHAAALDMLTRLPSGSRPRCCRLVSGVSLTSC